MFKCLASVDDLITGVFSAHFIIPKYCIFKQWFFDEMRSSLTAVTITILGETSYDLIMMRWRVGFAAAVS
jgi:hypothetical protein